jgi:hypothetical protein
VPVAAVGDILAVKVTDSPAAGVVVEAPRVVVVAVVSELEEDEETE